MRLHFPGQVFVVGLALLASSLAPCRAGWVHRWSFAGSGSAPNGTAIPDSLGGANGQVVGLGATFSGDALRLPGTSAGNFAPSSVSAYVDLPNGLLSSRRSLTIEVWATVHSNRSWQRLVDFGRMNIAGMGTGAAAGEIRPDATSAPGSTSADDSLFLAVNRGTAANTQQLTSRLNATSNSTTSNATLPLGSQSHFVITFQEGAGAFGATGGQYCWYLNGTLTATLDVTYRLAAIEDVNNWLGRSQYTADSNADISYNEVRIHDRALSAAQVAASGAAGPDAPPPAPVAAEDTATMHRYQKVLVDVVANDEGPITPGTVELVSPPSFGTATPDSSGRILYRHSIFDPPSDSFTYRVSGPGGVSAPAQVTIAFADQLRIPVGRLNVPSSPPATALSFVQAYPISFNQPVAMASPPGDLRRLFVCEKGGLLRVIPDVTAASPSASTFLNLPSVLTARGESLVTNSEAGLLSVAFHPNYAVNRQFFTCYSVRRGGLNYQRVSRWTANATNPLTANTTSEQILIEQRDEADNHNGGDMAFGPDGYLYISTGDEGNQNDSLDNSQTITKDFFSSILRIDPDKRADNLPPNPHPAVAVTSPGNMTTARYSVPADNPFVGATSFNGFSVNASQVRTEFWAVGLRNPWRMAFDPQTGELWLGDVGGIQREEVNRITRGANYGWAYREGALNGPKSVPGGAVFTPAPPIYEYPRGSGEFQGGSITGGVWARNNRVSQIEGAYVFADYVSSNVWALRMTGSNATVTRIGGQAGIVAFGRDPSNNDVLLADINTGRILRIVSTDATGSTYPQSLSATGLFADLADLSPAPGVLPYSVNRPFWSDHALKRRWFVLPDANATFTYTPEGAWAAPAGAIWVKHFDLETVRGDPFSKRRIETRVLVRTATGAYGVSYRWNPGGVDAALVPDEGVSFDVNIEENGVVAPQRWTIPSRASCMTCHTPQAGHTLSFKTRQMNCDASIHGFAGNQISTLATGGYFATAPPPPNTQPRHIRPEETSMPIAAHVRSYLEVNCAYCHMPGGTAPSNWDAREQIPIAQTGILNGIPTNNGGDPTKRLVAPGDLDRSVLLHRVAATGGFTRMPPIATNVLDQTAIAQIRSWIATSLPARKDYTAWRLEKFGSTTTPEGQPNVDADGDRAINFNEFLSDTLPTASASFPEAVVETADGSVSVSMWVPANRVAFVETSTDLVHWQRWNVPGNNGLPGPEGVWTFTGSFTDPSRFFRGILSED